jgi:ParB family chromosome partitioning protein
MAKPTAPATTSTRNTRCLDVPLELLVPDPKNRRIDESSESFAEMADSLRVLGVINRLHVREQADGTFFLLDGEKRWRAAAVAKLVTVPVEAWPADVDAARLVALGIVSNDKRDDHGAVQTARRLRQLKLEYAYSLDQLATSVSMPLSRVKLYSTVFDASEELLGFFEELAVSLALANEFVKYQKATNEAAVLKLAARHRKEPLTCQQLIQLRRKLRGTTGDQGGEASIGADPLPEKRRTFVTQFESAFRKDAAAAQVELAPVLAALGLRLVPAASAQPGPVESVA